MVVLTRVGSLWWQRREPDFEDLENRVRSNGKKAYTRQYSRPFPKDAEDLVNALGFFLAELPQPIFDDPSSVAIT